MSLLEASSGLLETHVTWEEVEARLQSAFATRARLGANRTISHIGEGNGFMSRIGLITCDWEGAEAGKEQQLPAKIALKMSTMMASRAVAEKSENDFKPPEGVNQLEMMESWVGFVKQVHNTEVEVYELLSSLGRGLRVPASYYSVPFTDENTLTGCIALEFFDNAKVFHVHETMSVEQVKQVARELGKIQAASVKKGVVRDSALARDSWNEFWSRMSPEIFAQIIPIVGKLDPSLEKLVQEVLPLVPAYHGSNLAMTIHEQIGCGRVLVNGDHWSANVLFDYKGDLRAIIDWQLAHFGVGVEDLLRICMSALSASDRRENTRKLLDVMYDSMEEHLEGAAAPYTRDQLFLLHDILLPHCAFFFAPVLTPVFMASIQAASTDEEKKERVAVIVDKVRGIYEDILIYHKRNAGHNEFKWKY